MNVIGDMLSAGGKLAGENDKLRAEVAALLRENERLRMALESVRVRAVEGDKRCDWLPTIANIAKAALEGEP